MVVTRGGFSQVVANSFAGLGFAPEAPTIFEFPIPMFLPGSDLSPINENIDKVVYGLTKWEPKIKAKGIYYPAEKITVQGKDYQDAVDEMNQLFLKNLWSDGLPLVPATQERVDWILTGTDLPRDTVVGTGKILPRGGIGTVESLAVQLAMAGGRPEYLPVLIAAAEAMTQPEYYLAGSNATTQSVFPAVVISGPIARQIRLGAGYGVLGPDPQHPAAGIIGRAFRLIQQDLGGAVPGMGTMAIYGGMRYTNAVLAEDEEGVPKGWKSLAEERGFARGSNVVTAVPVAGVDNVNITSTDAKDAAGAHQQFVMRMAQAMRGRQTPIRESPGLALFARGTVQALADLGWTKEKLKSFLWENSKISWADVVASGRVSSVKAKPYMIPDGQGTPIQMKPEQLMIVIAGGDQSGHGYWLQPGMGTSVVSKAIKLPKNWDQLLKQAEADLGPAPGF